jgi:hypothetical protein
MSEKVTTLERLAELANEKRSVSVNPEMKRPAPYFKHQPASFVMSMQGRTILRLFEVGMYVYEKEENKNG